MSEPAIQIKIKKRHLLAFCVIFSVATAASTVNILDPVTKVFGQLKIKGSLDLYNNPLQNVDWENSDTSGLEAQKEGGNLWYKDADTDGYVSGLKAASTQPGSNWNKYYLQSKKSGKDCQDGDNDAYPGSTEGDSTSNWFNFQADTFHTSDPENNDWDENCNGKIEKDADD